MSGHLLKSLHVFFTGRARLTSSVQSPTNREGVSLSFCREASVSRAKRQPLGVTYKRATDDADIHLEVRDHLFDESELLKIFLPEYRYFGLHRVEEDRHHRRYAIEVPRS